MLEKITEAEINERSMARVSNTPGRRTAFGQSEMNAEALKLRFDRLGRFLAGKINEILGSIDDGVLAKNIKVVKTVGSKRIEYPLAEFILKMVEGDLTQINVTFPEGTQRLDVICNQVLRWNNEFYTGDFAAEVVIVDGVTLSKFYKEFKQLEENGLGECEVKSVNGKKGDVELNAEDVGARPDTWMPSAADVGARPNTWTPTAEEVGARPNTWTPGYSEVGADKSGTAESKVSAHNVSDASHNDIRLLIQGLGERLNAIANSTDVDLDDFKEVVAYIKANRGLIDAITTNKINYTDIINDLVTNVTNKPLSAAQGVSLKLLIDNLTNSKLDASALTNAINTALAQAKASGEFNGEDGKTPYVGNDGYWYINGTSTGVKAQGSDGAQGIQGFNIVASVDRPSFTTANWDTYGVVGHEENWGGTSNAGVRVGDIFIIVGTATDTGIGHMLVYKYTGVKGGNTLSGQCLAHHIVAYRGAGGAAGTSVTVSSVSESTASGGTNVVNFSDGKKVSIKNGTNGKDGTNYVLTDADRTQIANIVTTQLGGQPLYGVVDANKVVTLRGALELDDTYTFGYIKNGEFVEIGKGEYVPDEPESPNLILTSVNTDGTAFGENGIVYGKRWGSSGTLSNGNANTTGLIACKAGDIVYLEKCGLYQGRANEAHRVTFWNTSKGILGYEQMWALKGTYMTDVQFVNSFVTQFTVVQDGFFAVSGINETGATSAGVTEYLDANSKITIQSAS